MAGSTRAAKPSRFRATFRRGWDGCSRDFLESFPKESMVNTLRGTRAAVD